MTQQWTVPAWLVLVVAASLVLLVILGAAGLRWRARTTWALAERDRESAVLRRQVEAIESRLAAPRSVGSRDPRDPRDHVVTVLGDQPAAGEPVPAPVVPPGVFADIVLRESVVQSASLLHGLRRALSPEVRHRIRFEVRREVKRSRKARRAKSREALRQWQARQRADESAA